MTEPDSITIPEGMTPSQHVASLRERITTLRDSFPSLRDHFDGTVWDVEYLSDWKNGPYASSGGAAAAAFVLHVWNHYRFTFDMGQAFNHWDDAHRAAWIAWAKEPWFA